MEERVNAELKVVLDQMPELIINKDKCHLFNKVF